MIFFITILLYYTKKKEILELNKKIRELNEKINNLENKYQSELKKNKELVNLNNKLNDNLNNKIEENKKLIQEKELLGKELKNEKDKYIQLQNKINSNNKANNNQLLELYRKIDELSGKFSRNNFDSKFDELSEKINNLNIQYQSELHKNRELISTNENLKNYLNNEIQKIKIEQNEIHTNFDVQSQVIQLYKRIDELKEKLSRYPFELLKGEQIISVIFTSDDQKIHYSVICKNTENFNRLEEKLYKDYPEYSEIECFFTANGNVISKFKSLDENNIHNSDIIILNKKNN